MENSSEAEEDLEFQFFDFTDVEFLNNVNTIMEENYQHTETDANFAKFTTHEFQSPSTRDDQTQLDQMNSNPDTIRYENLLVDQLVSSSPDRTNDSFLHQSSSNTNLGQPMYSGFEGNASPLGHGDAHETASHPFSPFIMEPTQSLPSALAKRLPQNGDYSIRPLHSEHGANSSRTNQANGQIRLMGNASQNEGYSTQPLHSHGINSVQTNQVNADIGNSLLAELTGPQRVESTDRGKTAMLADQFQQNNGTNNFNHNHQELPYTNPFIQSSGGIGYLGGSKQINQQAPTWVSYKENNFYRPLAPSGQQGTQFQATINYDPQRYNFMQPSPAPYRPQQFNNPLQRLNQVPNMSNASGSLLQQSMSTKHSMPFQHMPQYFSNQHDQASMAPVTYNPQTYSTGLLESSMPLRNPMCPPSQQINPIGASNLQNHNSLNSRAPMLSSGRNILEGLDEQRQYHRLDAFNPVTNQFGTRSSSSMLQESLMHSGSYRLPAPQHANSQFSTMHDVPDSDHHYPENSFLPRLQQQGLFHQTSRPVSAYPGPTSGTSLSSMVSNSLTRTENSGRRESLSWRGFESGEPSSSSPFKRMRASSAQQENQNFLSLLNEVGTRSNSGSQFGPRPNQNSVYDPKYERIGLPIDPHLRLFSTI